MKTRVRRTKNMQMGRSMKMPKLPSDITRDFRKFDSVRGPRMKPRIMGIAGMRRSAKTYAAKPKARSV